MSSLNAADNGVANGPDQETQQNNIPIESNEPNVLDTSLFVQHLSSYPAVAALASLAASNSVVRIFVSNAIPLVMFINERSKPVSEPVVKKASPMIHRVDKFGDDVLNNVDKRFPQLKTTHPSDVYALATKPVDQASKTVSAYRDNAKERVNRTLIDPIKAATHQARDRYSKVYDTQGKALIRSRVDPLVSPINKRLETVIVTYLPESGEDTQLPSSEELSNELSRSWRLARTAYRRAGPAMTNQIKFVREIPNATTTYIQKIYKEKQLEKSNGKKPGLYVNALAGLGTCHQLTEEGRDVIVTQLQNQRENLLAPAKKLYKNVYNAEEGAKAKMFSATGYFKGSPKSEEETETPIAENQGPVISVADG